MAHAYAHDSHPQVVKIRTLLRERQLGMVRVGTVDDYQGQEEQIVLISTVLAQGAALPPGARSLLVSEQRFNVAITRAKALLVVVGDPNTLINDTSWKELLHYAVENDAYSGCPMPLLMEGADHDVGDLASRMAALASSSLGSATAASIFPSLSADQSDLYMDYDDRPWRVML